MAGVMDAVNQRTQLVGQNRLELLLFRLDGPQLYGINVFKVREVLLCPKLTLMPKSHPVVCGVAGIVDVHRVHQHKVRRMAQAQAFGIGKQMVRRLRLFMRCFLWWGKMLRTSPVGYLMGLTSFEVS